MPNKRILVVDDEPNVTLVLARSLHKLGDGYTVDTAHSGPEALEKLAASSYALVITDYKMPKMSGLDLATLIRDQSPDTQVVLMTGHGTSDLRKTAGSMHLDGYLDKPFSMEQIRDIVNAVVNSTREHDPYRSGERQIDDAVYRYLKTLREDTGARCVMLLSSGGYPIDAAGVTEGLDTATIGALVAANFMAAVELSRLLGNASIFKSSYHEGPDYNVYSYDINGELLLAVIFGAEAKTGAVWFFTKQTASALAKLKLNQGSVPSGQTVDLVGEVAHHLDDLFSAPNTSRPEPVRTDTPAVPLSQMAGSSSPSLMTLEDAIAAGIVPADLGDAGSDHSVQ